MADLAILVWLARGQAALWPQFVASLQVQRGPAWKLRVLLGGDLQEIQRPPAADLDVHYLQPGVGIDVAWHQVLPQAQASWLAWCDVATPWAANHAQRLEAAMASAGPDEVFVGATAGGPTAWHGGAVRIVALNHAGLQPDAKLTITLASESLLWRLISRAQREPIAAVRNVLESPRPEPARGHWSLTDTYEEHLTRAFTLPLQEAAALAGGHAPLWLQIAVAQHLHWYFTVDARQKAPTVHLSAKDSEEFHGRIAAIMRFIDSAALEHLAGGLVAHEACHALWSYRQPQGCSVPTVDILDHDQQLVRVTYYAHGQPPQESWSADGDPVQPAHAKYRGIRHFHRVLFRQRIAWIPAAGRLRLDLSLAGRPAPLAILASGLAFGLPFDTEPGVDLLQVRSRFVPGKGGQRPLPGGAMGLKVRLMKAVAKCPPLRERFSRAWVFVDRIINADDSAEHLYRWVRQHHPEVNAWFLLRRDSRDWGRLKAEGFRLIAPGVLSKWMMLNADHIISSHTDYVLGGLEPAYYGDCMRWRFTFLQHGVTKDDVSHWLGPLDFDLFVTSSPAEHQSIVGDDTGYRHTTKEVCMVGMPRFDRLLRLARSLDDCEVNEVLVMPTWRGGLVDERLAADTPQKRLAAVAASDYASQWRSFLNSRELLDAAARRGMKVVFMPHPNALPFLHAFDAPPEVEIRNMMGGDVQRSLATAAVFVTDFTSVAFDMAFLRRPVAYFQFDRQAFYAGGHNWRPGHFDYDRDGFGPVAQQCDRAVANVVAFLEAGCIPEQMYLNRMTKAMPNRDELACERSFEAISRLRKHWQVNA